jgi:hypothetical protein
MRHLSDRDVTSLRMAQAAAVNPDVRELKRCNWGTSNVRMAPCELTMGHNGRCYNGDERCEIEASIEQLLTPEIRAQLAALRPPEDP